MVLDGPMSGEASSTYFKQVLFPTPRPGKITITGNLSAHQRADIQSVIEADGATLLFLSPYSPALGRDERGLLYRTESREQTKALFDNCRYGQQCRTRPKPLFDMATLPTCWRT